MLVYLVEARESSDIVIKNELAKRNDPVLCISALVIAECLVKPIKINSLLILKAYENSFAGMIKFDLDEATFRHAAQIRAASSLKLPDSLHLACAARNKWTEIWTNDRSFSKNPTELRIVPPFVT